MALTLTNSTPLQQVTGGMMQTKPWDPKSATSQASGGLQAPSDMNALMQALMQAKTKALLQGQLPGTTPQTLGQGTGMSDAVSSSGPPPLNLGGAPPLAGMQA
jgi:hypothetical protein